MKILQLCKKFPCPVRDGESLAILNLSRSLALQGANIDLLAMNTSRHEVAVDHQAPELQHYSCVTAVPVDNRIKPVQALKNLFTPHSYHISRFESKNFEEFLKEKLQQKSYDLIQLETLYLTPYIPLIRRYSTAKIVLRTHNVEFEIWQRIVRNTRWGLKRWYLAYLTRKLRRYELDQMGAFDLLAAITERDRKRLRQLGYSGNDITIPIGLPSEEYQPDWETLTGELHLSFIGSLDWMPNTEGLKWFLDHVWPDIYSRFPEVSFHVAGRNAPEWLKRPQRPGLVVHGEVSDAKAFINNFPVMVVPLLSGSGMRVKIIEAMALGRVVITTAMGLEGITAGHQEEVLIADTPYEFVKAIEYLLQENAAGVIGKNARTLVERRFDHQRLGKELMYAYKQLIKK